MSSPLAEVIDTEPILEIGSRLLEEEGIWAQSPRDIWGLPTGFHEWDALTGGLHRGEMTILAARQGSGKTSLGLQVSQNVTETVMARGDGSRVLVYSPEMGARALVMRLASIRSRVPSQDIRRGMATDGQREAWQQAVKEIMAFSETLLFRNCGRGIDIHDLCQDVRNLSHERPVALVVIDYINVITAGERGSAYERATEVSRRLRALSNTMDVPVLAMSQLARPSDRSFEPAPTLYEIRDSGNIEQDADNVITVYRPLQIAGGKSTRTNTASLMVQKQRNGGLGAFELQFTGPCMRFDDILVNGGRA